MRSQADILNGTRNRIEQKKDLNILQHRYLFSNLSADLPTNVLEEDLQQLSVKTMNNHADDNTENANISGDLQMQWQCPKVFSADSATVNMPATAVLGTKYINLTKNLAENHRNEKNFENHSWLNNHNVNNNPSQSNLTSTMLTTNSVNNSLPELLLAKINNNTLSYRNLEHYNKILPTTSCSTTMNNSHNLNNNTNKSATEINESKEHKIMENSLLTNSIDLNVNAVNDSHKTSFENLLNICNEYSDYSHHQPNLASNTTTSNDLTLSPIVQNRIKTNGSLSRERKSPFHHEGTNAATTMNHNSSIQQHAEITILRNDDSLERNAEDKSVNCNLSFLNLESNNGYGVENGVLNEPEAGRTLLKSPRTKIRTTYMSSAALSSKKDFITAPTSPVLKNQKFDAKIHRDNLENDRKMNTNTCYSLEKFTFNPSSATKESNVEENVIISHNSDNSTNLNSETATNSINLPSLSKTLNSTMCSSLSTSVFELPNSPHKDDLPNNYTSLLPETSKFIENIFNTEQRNSLCKGENPSESEKPTGSFNYTHIIDSQNDIQQQINSIKEQIVLLERQEKCILSEMQTELSLSAIENIAEPIVDKTKVALEEELQTLQQKIHRLESQRNATRVMEENKQAKLIQSIVMKQDQLKKLTKMLEKNIYDSCLQEEYHKLKESLENDSRLFEDLEFQYLEEESEWHGFREELNAEMKAIVLKIEEKRFEGERQKLNQDLNKMAISSKSDILNDKLLKVLKNLATCKENLKVHELILEEFSNKAENNANEDRGGKYCNLNRYSLEEASKPEALISHTPKHVTPHINCTCGCNESKNSTSMKLSNSLELLTCNNAKCTLSEINNSPINSNLMTQSVNENLIYNHNKIERENQKDFQQDTKATHQTECPKHLDDVSSEDIKKDKEVTYAMLLNNPLTESSEVKKDEEKNEITQNEKPEQLERNPQSSACGGNDIESEICVQNKSNYESSMKKTIENSDQTKRGADLLSKGQRCYNGGTGGDEKRSTLSNSSPPGSNENKVPERKRILPRHQRPLTRYLPIFSSTLDLRQHIESAGHQISLCPHVFLDSSSCRGYLHKLGATFHGWSKRWFVLDRQRGIFIYYTDKTERKPRGGAYFTTIKEVYLDHLNASKSGRPHCTFVVKAKERSYQLQAASAAAARIWIDVIITAAQANLGY